MKRLTIIVLNWNGLADTRALLGTLRRCRAPEGWALHVLVVDNGSRDGSPAALRAEFPEAELLELEENLRFAGGNNAGIRRALAQGADAIMVLNNDTEVDPALCEKLMQALEQNAGPAAATPLIYFGPPTARIWYAGGHCVPALGFIGHRGLRALDHGQYRSIERTGYLTGCCIVARREVWERVGLIDERYYIYAEDADWSLRARAAGVALLFVPTARLWHKVSASSGEAGPWKVYQRLRANLTLVARHARGAGRITGLPSFLIQQIALALWFALRGRFDSAAAIPRGLWHAMTGVSPGTVTK
ncbi:MAG TPA: glycosyltransferase family 2 protein [Candidatus Udaeobacter sp.]|jgi:GT2 family glycosyltransferase|nr:glycosyltransferase family 2 protein [Candidatus Udaeobacter sp.]